MKAETHKAAGVQHKQTGDTTPSPTHVSGMSSSGQPATKAVEPQLARLRTALDDGPAGGGMTWAWMV